MSATKKQFRKDAVDALASLRVDSADVAGFTRSLEEIEEIVREYDYTETVGRKFVNQVPSAEWAQTHTFRLFQKVGIAKIIAQPGDDLPQAAISASEVTIKIRSAGMAYSYSVQDLRSASKLNMPLDATLAKACHEAMERLIDNLIGLGDASVNMPGFLNSPNVTVSSAITGHWDTADPTEILADMRTMAQAVWAASLQTYIATDLVLPPTAWAIASKVPYSALNGQTVLQVMMQSPDPTMNVTVGYWNLLEHAGQSSARRAIAYKKTTDCQGLVNPIVFETFPPQPRGLSIDVPCHSRIGGVIIYKPLAHIYFDTL